LTKMRWFESSSAQLSSSPWIYFFYNMQLWWRLDIF
jgi:hypothetical protein